MKIKPLIISLIITLGHYTNLMAQNSSTPKKILVVYFSHSGNTRVVAQQIQKATGADIFEIKPVKDYPAEYDEVVEQAKKEIRDEYRPALKTKLENISQYDIIFVGSPN